MIKMDKQQLLTIRLELLRVAQGNLDSAKAMFDWMMTDPDDQVAKVAEVVPAE